MVISRKMIMRSFAEEGVSRSVNQGRGEKDEKGRRRERLHLSQK